MQLIHDLLELLGGPWCVVVMAAILAVVPSILGWIVLRPISHRAGRLRSPNRFLLSDFFWLVIQFQFVLGYSVRFIGVEQFEYFVLICGFLSLATIGLWAGAVSFMSRAGVMSPSRRAVFILFLLPTTLFLMMSVSFSLLLATILKFGFASRDFQAGLELMAARSRVTAPQLWLCVATLPPVCYGLRRTSLWVLAGLTPEATESQGESQLEASARD